MIRSFWMWCGKIYPSFKKINFVKVTDMTGEVMSWGKKSYGKRPHFVATRQHTKTLITHYPHLRFLSRVFHTRHKDNGTRGQRRWRCGTTGYRVEVNTGRHFDFRSCEISMLQSSPPSIVGERCTGRPAATTWPRRRILGHIGPRTWYLVF